MNPSSSIPVLMYHRVGETHNEWERKYCVSARRFAEHMNLLAAKGWRAITLGDFFNWLDSGASLPEKSFLLTFDDGFHGVYEHAAPVLTALNWPATVFLVSTLIGKRDIWCAAENPNGATYPLMDAAQIRELSGRGFTFHSHTRSHADLPKTDAATLRDELAGSRDELQQLLGAPVDYLAYPFGRYDARVIAAAQEAGYLAAFSTQPGFNRLGIERFKLRRLDIFGADSAPALLRKIQLGSNDGSVGNGIRYFANRVRARLGLQTR
jgi:peptidoglycan/xylan/chitin deacetylase (PgdA/CDA1 family)